MNFLKSLQGKFLSSVLHGLSLPHVSLRPCAVLPQIMRHQAHSAECSAQPVRPADAGICYRQRIALRLPKRGKTDFFRPEAHAEAPAIPTRQTPRKLCAAENDLFPAQARGLPRALR